MAFYIGKAVELSAADLTALAQKHGIEERALKAVVEVEANGKAFHSSGALVCLYEPHIAYRYTAGAKRDGLIAAGLAYPKWKRGYPATSFARIDKCASIAGAEVAALATSWGAPQIMGFNHRVCGYPTAVQMVKAFAESEAAQIEAMVRFIKANPKMLAALNGHDWATFARLYNGSGYKANAYDTKLAAAYLKAKSAPQKTAKPVPASPAPEVQKPVPSRPERSIWAALVEFVMKWLGRK